MRMFGRELTLEQTIGFVRCNAAPNEDLVHMAALELIAALQDAQRRERAAVEYCKSPHYGDGDYYCGIDSACQGVLDILRGPVAGKGEAE